MKKLALFGGAILAAIAMTGCSSVNTNDGSNSARIDTQAVSCTPQYEIAKEKVSGEASVKCLFGIFSWGVSNFADEAFTTSSNMSFSLGGASAVAKQGATYNACAAGNADCIVAAKYKLDTKDYFVYKTVKCTVTGFPATVKSVKQK